eukprot:1160117-Pelagomonas_calceolata.AAC.2
MSSLCWLKGGTTACTVSNFAILLTASCRLAYSHPRFVFLVAEGEDDSLHTPKPCHFGVGSLPDSPYPASPSMGNGTAGGHKGPTRVSFDTPISPSACVAAAVSCAGCLFELNLSLCKAGGECCNLSLQAYVAHNTVAGHGTSDWEDLRRPSVPRLSFRNLRTPNASRMSTSLNAKGSPSASRPASMSGSAGHNPAHSFSRCACVCVCVCVCVRARVRVRVCWGRGGLLVTTP